MSDTSSTLGSEIRRLRTASGTSLRGMARIIRVSAPHLSDIELDRRRPSKPLLEKIVAELAPAGATHAGIDRLDARFERDLQEWVAATPEVRVLLRTVKESGRPMAEVIKALEGLLLNPRRTK